jgi:hypothetical protein
MRPRTVSVLISMITIVASLGACRPDGEASPGASGAASATSLDQGPTTAPSETAGATPVPGFENWQVINPQSVKITAENGVLVMRLIGPALWLNEDKGVLFYRDVTGDFRATATVRTSKASDLAVPPGQDGTVQLAGLMARTEVPAENSVFIVSGSIGLSTGLETKTTTSGRSIWVQRGQPTGGDAELKVCRIGFSFVLLWRHVDSDEGWTLMSTFERRDMPQTLQVGANIYSDRVPDIVAAFEDLTIEPLLPGADC